MTLAMITTESAGATINTTLDRVMRGNQRRQRALSLGPQSLTFSSR
jgi:hypothetical protein